VGETRNAGPRKNKQGRLRSTQYFDLRNRSGKGGVGGEKAGEGGGEGCCRRTVGLPAPRGVCRSQLNEIGRNGGGWGGALRGKKGVTPKKGFRGVTTGMYMPGKGNRGSLSHWGRDQEKKLIGYQAKQEEIQEENLVIRI